LTSGERCGADNVVRAASCALTAAPGAGDAPLAASPRPPGCAVAGPRTRLSAAGDEVGATPNAAFGDVAGTGAGVAVAAPAG